VDADAFYEHLFQGTDLSRGHPVLALRKSLQEISNSALPMRANSYHIGRMFVKTWNAFAKGERISHLKVLDSEKLRSLDAPTGGNPFERYQITRYAA
jgi:hypothetical protein